MLTDEALGLVEQLHQTFEPTRLALLDERAKRQRAIDGGELPTFLPETSDIRSGEWQVAPPPPTSPTDGWRSPARWSAR